MRIDGAEDLSQRQLLTELERGGKVVLFQYCISLVVVTFKRASGPIYIPPGEGTFLKSLPYTLLSLFLGWWGFPWGFIYTPMVIFSNLAGGKDVTEAVIQDLQAARAQAEARARRPEPTPNNSAVTTTAQAPGQPVRVQWTDGREYHGQLVELRGDQALVAFEGQQPTWVPAHALK